MDDAKRKYEMKTIWLKITNWIINSAAVLRRWWAWCELSKCLKLWHFDLVCRRHQCTLDVRHVMRMRVESFLNSKSADELSRECLKLKLIWSHSTTFSFLSFRVRSNTNFSKLWKIENQNLQQLMLVNFSSKVNFRRNFGLALPTIGRLAQLLYKNSLLN